MSHQGEREPRVLKHRLSSRLFHWGLVLVFLTATITGFIIWLKPGSEEFINMAMKMYIVGGAILTVAVICYSSAAIDRIVVFIKNISQWGYNDLKWMMVGGGDQYTAMDELNVKRLKKEHPTIF